MSQPLVAPADWWGDLSAEQFSLIVESALEIPGLYEALGGTPDESGGVVPVRRSAIPSDVEVMFAGKNFSPRALHTAYLLAFRGWIQANPAQGDTGPNGLVTRWALLTGPSTGLSAEDKKLRAQLFKDTQPRYKGFRNALITVCTGVGQTLNDESVTGKRKNGRLVLDHSEDKLVKHGGKQVYRTKEGLLAHKRGITGFMGGDQRNGEDWKIMINRAVRHTRADNTTKALVARLEKQIDEEGAAKIYTQVASLRRTMVTLITDCWGPDFRRGLITAYDTWSKAAMPEEWKFAEVPSYAEGRILGSMDILWQRQGEVREFNQAFTKIDDAFDKAKNDSAFWDVPKNASEINKLFLDAQVKLSNLMDACQAVYEAQVDSSEKFYDWLVEWSKKQYKKGFRTEHGWVWAGLKAAKISLMAASLAASVTMSVLTLGTAAAISAPLFAGAGVVMDKLEKWTINHYANSDMAELDDEAKAREFLGEGYVTAQEKALQKLAKTYTAIRSSTMSEEDKRKARAAGLKLVEISDKVLEADETREHLETADKSFDAFMKAVSSAEQYEKSHEALENLQHVVNPISLAGPAAETATAGAVGGLKLLIEISGDAITLFVPPERKKLISAKAKAALEDALDFALTEMGEEKQAALKGALRKHKTRAWVQFTLSSGAVAATIVDADGNPIDLGVNNYTLRPRWLDRSQVLEHLLNEQVPRQTAQWFPEELGRQRNDLVYALHEGTAAPGNPYDPYAHDQTLIVAFDRDDVLDAFNDQGVEKGGRFVIDDLDGTQLLDKQKIRSQDGYRLTVSAEGVTTYEGVSKPPPRPKPSKIKTDGKRRVKAYVGAAQAKIKTQTS